MRNSPKLGDSGRITDPAAAAAFLLSGRAVFTLVSGKTSKRYTYQLRLADTKEVYFASVLYGPDNTGDFAYAGIVRAVDHKFRSTSMSRVREDDPRANALKWTLYHVLERGEIPELLELWHEGRCGCCGRRLTDPASIERGLGPVCAAV